MTASSSGFSTRQTCRICGSSKLVSILDMGRQYIAGQFVMGTPRDALQKPYPLELVRCAAADGCGLVQLRDSVNPSFMYTDYGYQSGINQTMRNNLKSIAAWMAEEAPLAPGDTVLDIGCNDGTLLESYPIHGLDRLGIDPSENVAALAKAKGLDVVNDFFSAQVFERVRPGRKAKAITSIAMFYDLEDPQAFVDDIARILDPQGLWVLELSYLPTMLERRSFDTVCHEHLEYYALRQIEWMAKRAGLRVARIEFNDINGGSFRLSLRHKNHPLRRADEQFLERIRLNEKRLGLETPRPYKTFKNEIESLRSDLVSLLRNLKRSKKRVYIYGASTKGNTILQYCGITKDLVPKAADRNPFKWGRRTLGTDIPIISEEQARRERPDYFLVMPWHFFPEFVAREHRWLEQGGRFIVPLPGVRIVGRDDLFIAKRDWAHITELLPIPTVDLLIVDKDRRILLHKRNNEPAARQWWFPGGRVHMNEARETAVLRKLMQECGLQAFRTEEKGTFDIIFERSAKGTARHSITTLYEVEVLDPKTLKLDRQSSRAEWRSCEEWLKEPNLHPFVAQALVRFG